jgi:hypothetical protein
MSPEAAPVLLDLAKTAPDEKYKTRALRGYIRIARQFDVPLAERIAMCRETLSAAWRADEKKLALEVLDRYPAAEGLALAAAQLGDAQVRADAAATAVAIAEKILESDPAAVADAMRKVAEAGVDRGLMDRAKALLDRATEKSAGEK